MTPVQLVLVVGPGGGRMDFVAGWLGCLPNFIDNLWTIDLVTGASSGSQQIFKGLDYGTSLNDIISGNQLILDANADLHWAGACHGKQLENILPFVNNQEINLAYIDISQVDPAQVAWEFYCKTYLTCRRGATNFHQNTPTCWLIDEQIKFPRESITNKHRVKKFQEILNMKLRCLNTPVPDQGVKLDYAQLFQKGGSRYLCENLGLTANDRHHQWWDHQLNWCSTLDTLEVWGHPWSRLDYLV